MPRPRSRTRTWLLLLPLVGAGCSSSKPDGGNPDAGGIAADFGNTGGSPDLAGSMGTGQGSVSGTVAGAPFGDVQTAWVIGQPDSNSTTVVYLFNKAVQCHDAAIKFGVMGWDANLPDKTRFLELKLFGPATPAKPATPPGDYTVVSSMTPATGEASCNHSLSSAGAASNEIAAASGQVTLASIVDKASAAGSFTIKLGADSLNGTFNAGYCDLGVEP
jgi:hypothetical protein